MTRAQSNEDIESRLTRLENLLMNTATLSNRNATDFDQMLAAFDTVRETSSNAVAVTQRNALNIDALTQDIRRNAADIRAMSQRVDTLAAAGERHDHILNYLLRREAGDIALE
jgi:hypothetical protein